MDSNYITNDNSLSFYTQKPTDSYELDTVIDLLNKQNNELKKLQPLTLEQLEEKRKREIQTFSDFFSSIDINVDELGNELNNSQTKRSR